MAPGKRCRIVVTFTPPQPGPSVDALVIRGNFTNSPSNVALVGTGK